LNALIRTEALGSTGVSTSFADGSGGWGDAIGGALERGDVDALICIIASKARPARAGSGCR